TSSASRNSGSALWPLQEANGLAQAAVAKKPHSTSAASRWRYDGKAGPRAGSNPAQPAGEGLSQTSPRRGDMSGPGVQGGHMRVLLVEAADRIARGVVAGLKAHGIRADRAADAAAAEAACAGERYDALVLDLGLPDRDGMDPLADLRRHDHGLAVVILTARDAIEHRLDGLHGGADDYLVKPFDLRELAARLHAVVRRARGRAVQAIQAGPLRLEPESGQAWFRDEPVALS